jgi:apolipoprotein N-acyltransferase
VTVSTTANSILPPGSGGNSKPPFAWLVVLLSVGLLGTAVWARRTAPRRVWIQFVTVAGVALLVAAWLGCGVNTSAPTFTPPGSYTVTLTGTAGSLSHAVRATLTVQ